MDAPRGLGLWGAVGGVGLLGGALAFFGLRPAPAAPAAPPDTSVSVCVAPRHHDCSFYEACIESNVACGPAGYALGFGAKYCERFTAAPLSSKGAAWADSVMLCLQQALLPYDKPDRKSATCDEISKAAFDSHPACYTALPDSICFLPPEDVVAVFDTIGADEMFAARTREQIQAVIATCTVQVAERTVAVVSTHEQPAIGSSGLAGRLGGIGHGSGHGRLGGSPQAKLWAGLAHKYGVPGARPLTTLRLAGVTVSPGLPSEVVTRVVRQNFGRFRHCYDLAGGGDAGFTGTVSVDFTIEPDGGASHAVAGAATTVSDAGLVACITQSFATLTYPAPVPAQKVSVTYGIAFDMDPVLPAPATSASTPPP